VIRLLTISILIILIALLSYCNNVPIDQRIVGKWLTTDIYPTTIWASYYDIHPDKTLKIVIFDPKKNEEVDSFSGTWRTEENIVNAVVNMYGTDISCKLRLSGDDMIVKCNGAVAREERFIRMQSD
jgi:hypothetical protein